MDAEVDYVAEKKRLRQAKKDAQKGEVPQILDGSIAPERTAEKEDTCGASSPGPPDGVGVEGRVEKSPQPVQADPEVALRSPVSAVKRKAGVVKPTPEVEVVAKKGKGKKSSKEGVFISAAEVEKEEKRAAKKKKKEKVGYVGSGGEATVELPGSVAPIGSAKNDGMVDTEGSSLPKSAAPKERGAVIGPGELTSSGPTSPDEVPKSDSKPNKVVIHFERNHPIYEDGSSSAFLMRQIRYPTAPLGKVRALRGANIYRGMSMAATKVLTLIELFVYYPIFFLYRC